MIFDRQAILEGAALDPAPGPPATIGERAGIDARTFAETQMSVSLITGLHGGYSDYLDEVEAVTGRRFDNPYDVPTGTGRFVVDEPTGLERFMAEDPDRPRLGIATPRRQFREKTVAEREAELFEAVAALQPKHPGLVVRSPESIREAIAESRVDLRERQADITRRTIDPVVSIAGHLATMGTAIVDPPILATMVFGAPWASGVLRGALIDAGIAAGVEVPVQAAVQLGRREVGEEPSLSEGLAAVAAVGGGGFLFSSLLRGLRPAAHGTRALLEKVRNLPQKRAEVRAAESYLQRAAELEEASPFPDTPRARQEHIERISEAELAVRESRIPHMPDRPAHPVRPDVMQAPAAAPAVADAGSQIGRVARQEALDRLVLGERERAAIEAVTPLLDQPEALEALRKSLRARPAKVESLITFLRRNGGLREFKGELRALGLPRAAPGLMSKKGQTLDDATVAAWEAGFFPGHSERPTQNDLLDAIGEELSGRKIIRQEDEAVVVEREALAALDEGLSAAGVDVRALKKSEFAPRLRDVQQSIEERTRGATVARMAQAGADAADIEERLAIMTEDGIAEADVRTRYEGRENETILLEDEDGVRRITIKDMFAGFERDADDLAAFRACAGVG